MNETKSSFDSHCVYLDQDIWQRLDKPESEQAFCSAWLELQCALFEDVEGGVVLLRKADGFVPSACWPENFKADELLSEAAERALETQTGIVLRPEHADADLMAVAYPIIVQGRLHGAVAMAVSSCTDSELQLLMRMVQWGIAWIENHFLRHLSASVAHEDHHASDALDMLAMMLEKEYFEDAAQALLNELTIRIPCDKVSLAYLKKGRSRVLAVSHNAKIDKKMNMFVALERAMDEAVLQKSTLIFPEKSRLMMREHVAYAENYGVKTVLTVLLHGTSGLIGAMSLERTTDTPFTASDAEFVDSMLSLAAPVLHVKRQQDRHLVLKIFDAFHSQLNKLFGSKYPIRKSVVAAILLLTVFFTFADGEYRVHSRAEIEGSIRRSISTPFDGYIAEANFRAGDRVSQGDVLCRMDDRDIQLEKRKWQGKLNQFFDQYHHAMAKHDKAEIRITQAKVSQAKAQLDLTNQQLQRSSIIAPFDGLVVSGDLSQAMGSAKRKGDVLFEITPLDSYRVILQVPEEDIRYVRGGQLGELHLSALPGESFGLIVKNITPVNQAVEGENYFRVEAALDTSSKMLRPGMNGVGKVNIGQRKLIWIWTHDLIDWLRLSIWSWWP